MYNKFNTKQSITLGSGACTPPAAESAYFQFDHTSAAPNPISSLDYAYVRKYANPDPLVISVPLSLAETCGLVNGAGPCTVDTQATVCRSQHCSPNGQLCVPESGCYVDADCGADTFCHRASYTCQNRLERGVALPADDLHDICPASGVSGACETNRCNPTANTCADENGTSCDSDAACVYDVCDADQQCGYAPGGPCTAQNASTACRSGLCSQALVCLAQDTCVVDGDCEAGQRCDAAAAACAAALTDGSKIPADHGICGGAAGTAGEPTAACASGQCNATTNTCAGANGETACTTASECVSNACGEDGRCGYADGSGRCSAADASLVCRSGACTEGLCGAPAPSPVEPERPDAGAPAPSAAAPEGTADDPWTGLGGGSGCSVGSQGDVSWMVALGTLLLGARRKRRAA